MPRNIDAPNQAQLQSNNLAIAFFAQIAFKSEIAYASTLPFDLNWNGHLWKGTGSLSKIGQITEGTDVQAYGTVLTLSGIDASLLNECLTDIQIGASATVWMVTFDASGNIIGAPTIVFSGQVDEPSIDGGTSTVSISLNLESPMINLGRGHFRRLTSADQHIDFPDDTAFSWVPQLSFLALRWGQS